METAFTGSQIYLPVRRQLILSPGKYTRTVQINGTLSINTELTPTIVFEKARSLALKWLGKKKRIPLSKHAISGLSWDYEDKNSQRALSIESGPGLWAMRLDDPCKDVLGRIWRVELAIGISSENHPPTIGCSLSVLVPAGIKSEVTPSVPAIALDIAKQCGLNADGHRIDGTAWNIETGSDCENLLNLLEDQHRSRAVVVLTAASGKYLIPP